MKSRNSAGLALCSLLRLGCRTISLFPVQGSDTGTEAIEFSLSTVDPEEHLKLFDDDPSLLLRDPGASTLAAGMHNLDRLPVRKSVGGHVPAWMIVPTGKELFPGVLLMDGSGEEIDLCNGEAHRDT